jgi:diacylglycerol kinase family enzyme
MKDAVSIGRQRGANTFIACGSDDTFNQMLSHLSEGDYIVGFIPFHEDSHLGNLFGIDSLLTAAKTIAGRRVEKLDVGLVGSSYFLTHVEFGPTLSDFKTAGWFELPRLMRDIKTWKLKIDDHYTIQAESVGGLIFNTRYASSDTGIGNPTDGTLDVLLAAGATSFQSWKQRDILKQGLFEELPGASKFKCKQLEILEPKGLPVSIAGHVVTKTPCEISILPGRLKVIVGKQREF